MRLILGSSLGLVAAFAVIIAFSLINVLIWPWPADMIRQQATTPRDAIATYVQALPFAAKLSTLVGYAAAALMGGLIANLITQKTWATGLIVGLALTPLGVINAIELPTALWIKVLNVAVLCPFAMLGARLTHPFSLEAFRRYARRCFETQRAR